MNFKARTENFKARMEDFMDEVQVKVLGLLESYLEYCKKYGYTDFRIWCEDNIDTIDEDWMVDRIYQEVNYVADKLFC